MAPLRRSITSTYVLWAFSRVLYLRLEKLGTLDVWGRPSMRQECSVKTGPGSWSRGSEKGRVTTPQLTAFRHRGVSWLRPQAPCVHSLTTW